MCYIALATEPWVSAGIPAGSHLDVLRGHQKAQVRCPRLFFYPVGPSQMMQRGEKSPGHRFHRTIARGRFFVYLHSMSSFGRFGWLVIASVAMATASGCSPGDTGQGDEEKEPHYMLGNSRYNEMDWPGAIDAFQESLEVNPHSAAAHFRLAELFDTKYPDPAAAIYHYQQYLKLEPDAKNREVINARIHSCKVLLASDECGLPDSPAIQKQMESLVSQNHQLQAQVDKLTAELRDWNTYYTSLKAAGNPGNNPTAAGQPAAQPGGLTTAPDDI